MTLLSVRDLRKSYGALKVTDELSMDVAEGELHAVIGPNGAGKTTLVAQLSGQSGSDAGQILYSGQDIMHLSIPERVQLGLARSFQITSVLPGFTVLENVALAVQARSGTSFRFFRPVAGQAVLNDAAMAALAEVELETRAGRLAAELSHGELRQLEIAIALATAPRLLLLDEPLAGTGGEESERLVGLLGRLKARMTIVLIEHDMQAVFALADRISVLVYGKIIATDTPAIIRQDAKVRAAYLGEEA